MAQDQNVRFVRINGRVVPIRGQGPSNQAPKKIDINKMRIGIAKRDISAGERFEKGFGIGSKIGAGVGGIGGAIGSFAASEGGIKKRLLMTGAGAVLGGVTTGLGWGVLGGAGNAAFGKRKEQKIVMQPANQKKINQVRLPKG